MFWESRCRNSWQLQIRVGKNYFEEFSKYFFSGKHTNLKVLILFVLVYFISFSAADVVVVVVLVLC